MSRSRRKPERSRSEVDAEPDAWMKERIAEAERRRELEGDYPQVNVYMATDPNDLKDRRVIAKFSAVDEVVGRRRGSSPPPKERYLEIEGLLAVDEAGRVLMVRVCVEPLTPEDGEVSTSTLRAIRLNVIRSRALRALRDLGEELEAFKRFGWPPPLPEMEPRMRRAVSAARAAGSGRRLTDDYLRHLTLAYLDLTQEKSKGVLADLANSESARLGRSVSRTQVHDWLSAARERGFLKRGSPGRASGEIGPNFYAEPEAPEGADTK